MALLHKIRAFFSIKGEIQELFLSSAEIKKDKVFLHPVDDPLHTLCVKSKTVEIFINPKEEVLEKDIEVIDTPKSKPTDSRGKSQKDKENDRKKHHSNRISNFITKKRRISILLYPEEYDMIMNHIQSHGYKKTEYFLACAKAARQTSLDSAYKYYTKFHKQKKAEDIQKAKEVQQSIIKEEKRRE